ncbi:MAG: prepilin peptidase [Fibrobacterota bacterium]
MTALPTGLILFFSALFGALLGSFFNVLVYRLPRGESIVSPPSACPECNHPIRWYDNIPLLSWLNLGGQCRFCSAPISLRYPAVELSGALYSMGLVYLLFLPILTENTHAWYLYIPLLVQYLSCMVIIPLILIDLRHYIIPDSFTLGGLVIGLAVSFIPGGISPAASFTGALTGGGILLFFAWSGKLILKRDALGGGDIKMLAWFGALWGPAVAAGTIFIGAFCGLIMIAFGAFAGKVSLENPIPFGPALCCGLLITLLWGNRLWEWYSSFFNISL